MSDSTERARQLLQEAGEAVEALKSYACVIHCNERINGKVRKAERIISRYERPGSVYLRWLKGPYEGLQASHVPHRDGEGKFQAREKGIKGLAGAVTFPHDSPIIDKAYPHHFRTHETSVVYLIELALEIQAKAVEMGKMTVIEVTDLDDPFLGRPATKVVCQLSSSPADGLRWLKTEFFFDHETKIPLHFKLYDFDGEMFGEYAFTEFEPGVSFSDDDFLLKKL